MDKLTEKVIGKIEDRIKLNDFLLSSCGETEYYKKIIYDTQMKTLQNILEDVKTLAQDLVIQTTL